MTGTRDGDGPRTVLSSAPKEINRLDVLGELMHRFERANPNDAIAWVLDELIELDILKNREPALCAEIEGATGIRCQQPSGHVGGHKGTSTEAQTAAVGYPLFVSWPGETVGVTSDAVRSVRVVNEPHGLPTSVRQAAADRLAAGDKDAAVRGLYHFGMTTAAALAYVEGMSEYQSYLSEHGETREPRVFMSDGPEPPPDVVKLEAEHDLMGWSHLERDGDCWRWSNEHGRAFGAQRWEHFPHAPIELREVLS